LITRLGRRLAHRRQLLPRINVLCIRVHDGVPIACPIGKLYASPPSTLYYDIVVAALSGRCRKRLRYLPSHKPDCTVPSTVDPFLLVTLICKALSCVASVSSIGRRIRARGAAAVVARLSGGLLREGGLRDPAGVPPSSRSEQRYLSPLHEVGNGYQHRFREWYSAATSR
jgi:hypothetical protein